MKIEKGIILAGGSGSRLYPLTLAANKQLLPIYDKPVLYYPLTTLMLAGIKKILIISNAQDLPAIQRLLGTGKQLGVEFTYLAQEKPNGLPEAFVIGEEFINSDPVAMILGDNFFHGHGLSEAVFAPAQNLLGAHIFTHHVEDPERYGIAVLSKDERVLSIEEKPLHPKSSLAVTGLYYFDGSVSERARKLVPSSRNELEIVDLIKSYIQEDGISVTQLGRGFVWFDTGTPKSLLEASHYVEVIQSRQGVFIASPEEVAWRMGFINELEFQQAIASMPRSQYREYLSRLMQK